MDPIQTVYNALLNVLASHTAGQEAIKASEAALKELVNEKGNLLRLQTIALNHSLDPRARELAIIQAKNNMMNQWKSKAKTSDEDLPILRQNMFLLIDVPSELIAKNNQTMAAKAVRLDYPGRWPTAFSDLMGLIQASLNARMTSPSPTSDVLLRSTRALAMLNSILKEVTSMRSPTGTQINTKATAELYPFLSTLVAQVSTHVQNTLSLETIGNPLTVYDLEVNRLSWKCWTKIMLWAWTKTKKSTPEEDKAFQHFFQAASSYVQQLWGYRTAIVQNSASIPQSPEAVKGLTILTKLTRSFGKAFRRMQQTGIARFVLLPDSNTLVLSYWQRVVEAAHAPDGLVAEELAAPYPTSLVILGLVLFKESLGQWSPVKKPVMQTDDYNGWWATDWDTGSSRSVYPDLLPKEVLSQEFVTEAVDLLITKFIPLKPGDLEKWEGDPEEFLVAEDRDNESWQFDLRPSGERVLMTLATQYPDFVTPLLQQLFQTVLSTTPSDLPSVLQREAVYCALGRCAHRMKGLLDFDNWLNSLQQEARSPNPLFRILKRRIAWLVGKWHYDDTRSAIINVKVWDIIMHLVTDRSEGSDPVVRLTAVVALCECVENNDFDVEGFQPYLGQFLGSLIPLIGEAETVDSKNRVYKTMTCIIGGVGQRVVPFLQDLASAIEGLWIDAGTEYMLKQGLLIMIKELVDATKEHSVVIHPLIVKYVQESFQPPNKSHLDEDALNLWESALRNCNTLQGPPGQPGLGALLGLLVALLGQDYDLLGSANKLLESYYLLDADALLRECANEVLTAYRGAHQNAITTNMKDITESLELLIQLSSSSMLWAEPMHQSGLFPSLLNHAIAGKGSVSIICDHFYIFSRMILQDPNIFIQLVVGAAAARNEPEQKVLNTLLDQWWRNFDSMAEPRHRKLNAMTMANLATTGRPEVIERLPTEISNVWLDVLAEIKEAESNDPENPSPLHMYWSDSSEPPAHIMRGSEGTLEEQRRKNVWTNDPVRTVKMTLYISTKLKEVADRMGPAVFEAQFVQKIDPDVWSQLQKALSS